MRMVENDGARRKREPLPLTANSRRAPACADDARNTPDTVDFRTWRTAWAPATLRGMSAPASPAAALLSAFDPTMADVRRVLARVPADRLDFRPHPKSWTTGELAMHLARLPGWTGGMLSRDAYDLAPNEAPTTAPPSAPASLAIVLARFDENVAAARAAIAACDATTLSAPWSLRRGDLELRTMTRAEALRVYLLDHAIHHRGQLTVYLRLLDVSVPALFGSSADEPT